MSRKRVQKCRACKKNPVWRGGDVKNPGPVCKRCYHKGRGYSGGKWNMTTFMNDPEFEEDFSWTTLEYTVESIAAAHLAHTLEEIDDSDEAEEDD